MYLTIQQRKQVSTEDQDIRDEFDQIIEFLHLHGAITGSGAEFADIESNEDEMTLRGAIGKLNECQQRHMIDDAQ
jgi:hypothetical protein